jgi:putative transposase
MDITHVTSQIKAIFKNNLPHHDTRCKVQPIEFISALICSFSSREGRVLSVSGMRQAVRELTQEKLSRGTFWERVATRKNVKLLQRLLGQLMLTLCTSFEIGIEILKKLGVTRIYLLDSSSFGLPEAASEAFPAPRNNVQPSGVKVHGLYDLFGGIMRWFDITPATTHDRNGFPPFTFLKESLIIFDLGYWDYQLLSDMIKESIFFLCRVKVNAKIKVKSVIKNISRTCVGLNFSDGRLDSFRGKIVEFKGEITVPKSGSTFDARVIGFWSYEDGQYHWYITNLKISSFIIYPLYRLRWQLELVWKSWKTFLHMDEIKTANKNIIHSILLLGMCAGLLTSSISISAINDEPTEKQDAFSVQRAAKIFIRIFKKLFEFICNKVRNAQAHLKKSIELFKDELFDPNYKTRKSSIAQVRKDLYAT